MPKAYKGGRPPIPDEIIKEADALRRSVDPLLGWGKIASIINAKHGTTYDRQSLRQRVKLLNGGMDPLPGATA